LIIFRRDERRCSKCNILVEKNFVRPILEPEGKEIINKPNAFQITWMLRGTTKRGTAKSLRKLKLSLGGKTGTTNDNMDAWFLGFSPEIVVGVYVGFDNPKSLGDKETGGKVAVPIFSQFISEATKKNSRPFLVPEEIEMIKIDYDTGKKVVSNKKNTIYEAFVKGTYADKDLQFKNQKDVIKGFEGNLY